MNGRRELVRPFLHLATGVTAFWVLLAPSPWRLVLLVGALAATVLLDGLRKRPAFRRRSDSWLPCVYRPEESGSLSGASLLLLGYVAAVAIFPPEAAAAGIVAAAVGDPAAALAGRWYAARSYDRRRAGRTAGAPGGKTWFGSLACFLAAAPALWLLPELGWPAAAAGAGLTALVERCSGRYDNVMVPLAVSWFAQGWLLPA